MSDSTEKKTPLYDEHALLGAAFRQGELDVPLTSCYAAGGTAAGSLHGGALLADLTGLVRVLYLSGEPAASFDEAAFAGPNLGVGEASFSAVLLGDGTVASIPLVARTGDRELLALDASPHASTLAAWLSFLASIEQQGFRPFEGLSTEDESLRLVPLALWGRTAPGVLGDYVGGAGNLPQDGSVRSLDLDRRITTLTIATTLAREPLYVLLVAPAFARVIWRSLLSFDSVRPTGADEAWRLAADSLPWLAALEAKDKLRMAESELLDAGLVRPGGGYVGARGLHPAD